MAVYTKVEQSALEFWLTQNYQIEKLSSLQPILEGIENTNYCFSSSGGKYIFSIFEVWQHSQVDFYILLMRHLANKGLPVPKPEVRVSGDCSAATFTEKPATVVPFMDGESLKTPSDNNCLTIGETISSLHKAAEDFPEQLENPRGIKWWSQVGPKLFSQLSKEDELLLKEELDFQSSRFPQDLPKGICHCDLFRNNVLWKNGKINAIIDFYFGGEELLIFDLAVCANDWCITEGPSINKKKLQSLISGYKTGMRISEKTAEMAPTVWRAAALRFWVSRLYDIHFPRKASKLVPHSPDEFRDILLLCRETSQYLPDMLTQA